MGPLRHRADCVGVPAAGVQLIPWRLVLTARACRCAPGFDIRRYWRPTMYFDVDAELREALEGGKGSSRRSSAHAAPDGGAH